MPKYFIACGNKYHGPIGPEELVEKLTDRRTPVWRPGMAEWSPAGDLPELSKLLTHLPPPLPGRGTMANAGRNTGRTVPPPLPARPDSTRNWRGGIATAWQTARACASLLLTALVLLAVASRLVTNAKGFWQRLEHEAATQRQLRLERERQGQRGQPPPAKAPNG